MPMPNKSIRCSILGTMANGASRWSTSFVMSGGDGFNSVNTPEVIVGVLEDTGVLGAMQNLLSTADKMTEMLCYGYGAGGTLETQGRATIDRTGGSGTSHAKSCSAVVTLRTAVANRTGRGRMYCPATGLDVSATSGLFTAAPLQTLASAIYEFTVSEISKGAMGVYSSKLGVIRPVVDCDIDRIPDRQESRERGLTAGRLFGHTG